jgi:hypothetical protein
MLAIGGIGTSTTTARTSHRDSALAADMDGRATESRALIPIAAPTPSQRSTTATRRPLASFLAHLIATQAQAPQTRTRRRAEPEEVLAVYGVASTRRSGIGRRLARDA